MLRRVNAPAVRGWEDYWPVAVRRRWWIALPTFLCWSAIWGASWLVPSSYESDALILVEQQKVPDQYVLSNVTTDLQDRLQSITQQILSRTRLQGTIDRRHLYPRGRGIAAIFGRRDAVDEMRDDIRVELVRAPGHPGEFTAFKMHYSAATPAIAQQVNGELTSLFVQENAEAQAQISAETTEFLAGQLTEARVKMEEQEAKVAAFQEQRLAAPALLVVLAAASAALAARSRGYAVCAAAQVLFYFAAAGGGWCRVPVLAPLAAAARGFCMLNLAVVAGFHKFLFTRGPLWSIWTPTPPLEPAAAPAGIPHAPAKISENVFLGSRAARPADNGAD